MFFHYYLAAFSYDFEGVLTLDDIVSVICKKLEKSKESIVICDENNSRLSDDILPNLSNDSHVLVYDVGRVLMDGLNKEGRCTNKDCSFFNKVVVENCGFMESERIYFGCCGTCPFCGALFEVLAKELPL